MDDFLTTTASKIQSILNQEFLGNSVLDYLVSLGILLGLLIVVFIFHKVFMRTLKKIAEKSDNVMNKKIINLIRKNLLPLLYFGCLWIALLNLEYSEVVGKVINFIGLLLLAILLIRFAITLIKHALKNFIIKRETDEAKAATIKAIYPIINILFWGIGIIFLLDNMGFNISAVIAGLGIGGVAIALAAQSVLGDLFSYFCILFDKPFVIGDFIIMNDFLGVIEHIGIKTTRIRSLSGEILIFSNTKLTGTPIRNFKHMKERRVVFKFGVTYNTENEKLKIIPGIVKKIIQGNEHRRFDRAHFNAFGDSSLNYEVVYYIDSPDYNLYMDLQQDINLKLKKELSNIGVEFAFPTTTVYLEKSGTEK